MQDLAGLAAAATQMTSKPHSTLTAPSPQDLTCYFQPAHGACPAEVLAESELQVSFRARPESPPTWGAEGATLTALCAQFTANFQLEHPWDIPERFRVCAPTPTPLSHTIPAASASCELGSHLVRRMVSQLGQSFRIVSQHDRALPGAGRWRVFLDLAAVEVSASF